MAVVNLDPTKYQDWEIAEAAEDRMKTVYQLADELGLEKEELLPHGHYVAKVDYKKVLGRLAGRPDGKYINVTAITPTPGRRKIYYHYGLAQGWANGAKNICHSPPAWGKP